MSGNRVHNLVANKEATADESDRAQLHLHIDVQFRILAFFPLQLQDIVGLSVQPPQQGLEGVQSCAFVAAVPLGAESKLVVLEHDADVRRVRLGVPLGVLRVLGAEILAGLPSLRPKEPLAEGIGVARPFGVVGIVSQLPLAVFVCQLCAIAQIPDILTFWQRRDPWLVKERSAKPSS